MTEIPNPGDIPMTAPALVAPTRAAFLVDLFDAASLYLANANISTPILVGDKERDRSEVISLLVEEKDRAQAERDGEPPVRIVPPDASELVNRVEAAIAILGDDGGGALTPARRNMQALEFLQGLREVPAYKAEVHVPPVEQAQTLTEEQRIILGEVWTMIGGMSLAQVRAYRADAGQFLSEVEQTFSRLGVEV